MPSLARIPAALALMALLAACGGQSAPAAPAGAPIAAPSAPAVAPSAAPSAPTAVPASAAGFPLTIADATGKEFTFGAPPKIGCWWAGCTEMLADLGLAAHAGSYTEEQSKSVFLYPAGVPQQHIADTQNPEHWAA